MRGMMGIGVRRFGWSLGLLTLLVGAQPASAEVLSLFELDQMTRFVVDQACGSSDPCPDPNWNKDGSASSEVLTLDLELATLQFWNEEHICYQNEDGEADHLGVYGVIFLQLMRCALKMLAKTETVMESSAGVKTRLGPAMLRQMVTTRPVTKRLMIQERVTSIVVLMRNARSIRS